MTERERFEAWVSAPPFERDIRRFPMDDDRSPWPGAYRDIGVDLAWMAWQEAQRPQIEDIGQALKDAGTGVQD